MSLCRAIELIGFLQRGRTGHSVPQEDEPHESTQAEQDRQFSFLQGAMGAASSLPPDLKDAIQWAEEKRKKHRIN